MKYQAVIFDLFGTLTESVSTLQYNAMLTKMAEALSILPDVFKELWAKTASDRMTGTFTFRDNIEHICRQVGVPIANDKIALAGDIRFDMIGGEFATRKDAVAVISKLRSDGLKIGLISDCSHEGALAFRKSSFAQFFDAAVLSCEVGLEKPDPAIYRLATKKLDARPEDCLYIGDGGSQELSGASRAGMDAVLVDFRSDREVYRAGRREVGRSGNNFISRSAGTRQMKKFSVVSVDMFGTLANIDSVASSVWRTFLKDGYTDELGRRYWERASELMFKQFDKAIQERRFALFDVIYKQSYAQLFPEIGIDFDPAEAARILAHQQSFSQPFADVAPFLESVGKHYPICISSDTDEDMLGQLRRLHAFDNVFTSESLGTYKADVGGTFFAAVVAYYHEEPGRIIHIGDSVYDVIGAKEAGIVTCWLNRNGKTWSHEIKPDYEVKSLAEAAALLEIESMS